MEQILAGRKKELEQSTYFSDQVGIASVSTEFYTWRTNKIENGPTKKY